MSTSDLPAIRRQLRIKSGVVKRLSKENKLYIIDTESLQKKLDKLIVEHAESWDLNNGIKLVEESRKMVKDTADRLGKAAEELRDLIDSARKESGLAEDEALLEAIKVQEELQG